MGIIDRIKLNVRANLNYALDKVEDPQKMIDQFLLDLRESVQEFKKSIANAISGLKSLEREISVSAEKASLWEKRALLALKNGDEDLAKKALDQKLIYAEKERNCKKELEAQISAVGELKSSLSTLETKLDELYQKRTELIKRSMQLQRGATQRSSIKNTETQLGIDTSVFDTYDTIVDKVSTLEEQVEALSELVKTDKVEDEFKKMEKDTKIEAELKVMKDRMKSETEEV